MSQAEHLARLAEDCRERFGRVDVLVNNAGILRLGAWEDVSEGDWRQLFEVNLLGVAVSCVCPLLVRTNMGDAGQAGVTRQPDWLFRTPEHVAGLVRRTVGSRRFLVYGHPLLHALHLLYRWIPGLTRALLASTTRRQQATRAASPERRA